MFFDDRISTFTRINLMVVFRGHVLIVHLAVESLEVICQCMYLALYKTNILVIES